jgi:hypothetical protein
MIMVFAPLSILGLGIQGHMMVARLQSNEQLSTAALYMWGRDRSNGRPIDNAANEVIICVKHKLYIN